MNKVENSAWPSGFREEDRKLAAQDQETGRWVKITDTRIRVMAFVRDVSTGAVSVQVEVEDFDGHATMLSLPAADLLNSGTRAVRVLAAAGLQIVPNCEKDVAEFIRLSRPAGRLVRTTQAGWLDGRSVFIRPDGVISKGEGSDVLYEPPSLSLAMAFCQKGTLTEWQNEVAALARGNKLAVFAICAALTGPLLNLVGFVGGGYHLCGRSSRGKTTLSQLAASVWHDATDPTVPTTRTGIRSWSVTGNSLDALCMAHSDQLLVLDEIGAYAGKDFDEVVYRLAGGQEKASLTSARKLRDPGKWRSNIISTGEISVRQKIEQCLRVPMAGQLVRLVDIPVGDVFTATGGLPAAEFASKIKHVCRKYFGSAGSAFVTALIDAMGDDPESLAEDLRDHAEDAAVALATDGMEPEQMRVLRRFGLVVTAGELAAQFRVLPFSDTEIRAAVEHARDLWLRGGNELSDSVRAVDRLRAFILRNHGAFPSIDSSRAYVNGAKGFWNGRIGAYLFDKHQITAATGNANPEEVARELREMGLLVCHEPGRLQTKQRVAWLDGKHVRFFTVRASILGEADDDSADVVSRDPLGLDD